jgi:GDPmannose 4,6-dehydratase
MSKKVALITGINGMDGSHLADFLLEKDYTVFGMEREGSSRKNTKHLLDKVTFIKGDLTDQKSLLSCLVKSDPDEVYNLAAQSFVGESWRKPEITSDITGVGVLRLLESIREYGKRLKYYQASSSEMFGRCSGSKLNEASPFLPRSPYGVSKLYGYWMTKNYRETYDMFNCSGILFNHESERRGSDFVTKKISEGVAKIHLGMSDSISLGNLDSRRDWGYSPDYVEAMWMMMQKEKPCDYVIATSVAHSIRDFLDEAFKIIGIEDWSNYIYQDPRFMRPAEVDTLIGDFDKADNILGWRPKTSFKEIVEKMVNHDIRNLGGIE